jgi:membrane-bound lytic murein transglycosylase D
MQQRLIYIFAIPLITIALLKLLSFTEIVESPAGDIPKTGQMMLHQNGVGFLPIPENLSFAGEPVPVHNFDIAERFDREILVNSYWQSQTLLFFKRANRWFQIIEPILEQEKIPNDFKYLALIESGLMNVASPAGAAGFWQIMATTGKELGLEVNNEIDERYHLEKSTRAAARFLRSAHSHFGSWTSAAAAYNMGRAGLNRQMTRQNMLAYYDLWLNEETSRYVFRILAIKSIFENPAAYGFIIDENQLYPPLDYYTVKVDTTVTNLISFAHKHNITYKELRTLNPWIRGTELPNRSRKVYDIKITNHSLFGFNSTEVIEE